MVSGIGGELVSNSGPGLLLDQRRMLAGVELTLVRNLTDVNRVREQSVNVPARNGFSDGVGSEVECTELPKGDRERRRTDSRSFPAPVCAGAASAGRRKWVSDATVEG